MQLFEKDYWLGALSGFGVRRKALNQNPLKSMRAGQHIMTAFLDQKKSKRYPGIYSWRIATCHTKSISITRFFLFKKKPFCMLTLDQKQSDPAFYAQKTKQKKSQGPMTTLAERDTLIDRAIFFDRCFKKLKN